MIIKPNIDIKPYCVFCERSTDHVASHLFYEPDGNGYSHILVRFPAHHRCFVFRKLFKFAGLVVGGFVFFVTGLLCAFLFSLPGALREWPLWLWAVSILAGGVSGVVCFFKMHFKTLETIHAYYVLNEILPEADKSWRHRPRRYKLH